MNRIPFMNLGKLSLFIFCLMLIQTQLSANTTSNEANENVTTPLVSGYTIGDYVWKDYNRNGQQDFMERGIKDVFIGLLTKGDDGRFYTEDDEMVAYTTTDFSGKYAFENIEPGEYVVQIYTFSLPDNYIICPRGKGDNADLDSDFNPETGISDPIIISAGARSTANNSVDAGIVAECGTGYTSVKAGRDQVVPKGSRPELLSGLTIPSDQINMYEFQWMRKTLHTDWEPIEGATEYTYQPSAAYQDVYYVLCFRLAGCSNEYKESNVVLVQIGECNVAIETDFYGNGCVDQAHVFTAGGMSATTTYVWEAEDGTIIGTGKEVTITWAAQGDYCVKLTATSQDGCSHTTQKLFRILECNDYPCCVDGQILTVLCYAANPGGEECTVYVPCEYTEDYLASGEYYCGECESANYCYSGTGTTGTGSTSTGSFIGSIDDEIEAAEDLASLFEGDNTPDVPGLAMTVYPNPAGSQTTVAFNANDIINENVTIQLINRQAGLIMQQEIPSHNGLNELPLDLNNIAPGLYFIRIIKGDEMEVKRFVKMDRP